jgi:hypothetical protein
MTARYLYRTSDHIQHSPKLRTCFLSGGPEVDGVLTKEDEGAAHRHRRYLSNWSDIPPFVEVLILALLSHVLDLPWLPQHHLHSVSILSADPQGPIMLLSVNTSLLVLYSKLGIVR